MPKFPIKMYSIHLSKLLHLKGAQLQHYPIFCDYYMTSDKSHTNLVEVWTWFWLPNTIEVFHIDKLEIKPETRVGNTIFRPVFYVCQIAQSFVPPLVQVADAEIIKVN
jgi:hypothetical protein